MTSPLGQYGAAGYESPEARTLGKFATDKFSYREQAKNIIELNNAVGYMSAYMRKMQRGIDDANRNFVQDIQALINDLIVLLGGGGDTGFDWGDLKYVIQAIGALFGFVNDEGEITVPINLFNAAWYFFSTYILPVQNFTDAINFIVDGLIASVLDIFGEVPVVGQALQQLAVIISDIRDLLNPVAAALQALLDSLSLDIGDVPGIQNYFGGVFKPIFDALNDALQGINLPDFSLLLHEIALWTLPFVETIANVINALAYFVNVLTGAEKAEGLQDILIDLVSTATAAGTDATEALANVAQVAADLVTAIVAITGNGDLLSLTTYFDNLKSFLPDFSTPGFDPVQEMIDWINDALLPTGLFGSAVSAIINAIRPESLAQVPLSSITNTNPNLLWNGGFDDAVSIASGSDFSHDATVGRTAPFGSARVVFNGTDRKPLWGNEILAMPGDVLTFTGYVRYENVVVSLGNSLELYATAWRANDAMIEEVLIGGVNGSGTNLSWTQLTGNYTPPAQTAYVTMELKARSFATSGTGWFDDCQITKTPAFQMDWVKDLTGRVSNLDPSGWFDASKLLNMMNIPLIDGTRVWSTENHVNGMFTTHFKNMIARFQGMTDANVETVNKAQANSSMEAIYNAIQKNMNDIMALQTPVTGTNFNINFSKYPNGPLPSNEFEVSYVGTGSSTVGVNGGKLKFINMVNNGARTARGLYLLAKPSGDNCTLKATLDELPEGASGGSGRPRIWAAGRLSADWLNFVFIRGYCTGFLSYRCDIGCYVNGVEYLFQEGVQLNWVKDVTLNFGVGGNPRRYQGYSGNNLVIDYTEPSAISVLPSTQATPSNFRSVGMIGEATYGSNGMRSPGSVVGVSVINT